MTCPHCTPPLDLANQVNEDLVKERSRLFKDCEDHIQVYLADIQNRWGITGDVAPWEYDAVEGAIQAFCQAMTDWMMVDVAHNFRRKAATDYAVQQVYAVPDGTLPGGYRALSADECEALDLDPTGRDL